MMIDRKVLIISILLIVALYIYAFLTAPPLNKMITTKDVSSHVPQSPTGSFNVQPGTTIRYAEFSVLPNLTHNYTVVVEAPNSSCSPRFKIGNSTFCGSSGSALFFRPWMLYLSPGMNISTMMHDGFSNRTYFLTTYVVGLQHCFNTTGFFVRRTIPNPQTTQLIHQYFFIDAKNRYLISTLITPVFYDNCSALERVNPTNTTLYIVRLNVSG